MRLRWSIVLGAILVAAAAAVVVARRPSEDACRQRYERQLGRAVPRVEVQWRWRPRPGWRCVEIFDL
jgi:hypothetical protein